MTNGLLDQRSADWALRPTVVKIVVFDSLMNRGLVLEKSKYKLKEDIVTFDILRLRLCIHALKREKLISTSDPDATN